MMGRGSGQFNSREHMALYLEIDSTKLKHGKIVILNRIYIYRPLPDQVIKFIQMAKSFNKHVSCWLTLFPGSKTVKNCCGCSG